MNHNKAFTLVELAVAAVIVGFLAIMTVPNVLKSMNRSYSQDAMHNLMAIYGAQHNYANNNNSNFKVPCPITCINDSIAGLGLNIVSTGVAYSCAGTTCEANKSGTADAGGFRMIVTLTSAVTMASPVPLYTNGNPNCTTTGYSGTDVGAGKPCP